MNTIEVTYLHEAQDFMFSIDEAASKKLAYNIGKVCLGIKDKDIFSKLGDTDIWEFRALHNGMCYRLFSFLGHQRQLLDYRHARHCQEIAENTQAGDSEGRSDKV